MRLILGDCLTVLPTLESASIDCVITDPPYPCIKRQYGYWTEEEWFGMMRVVVPECMRILKPTGSAVFILQPNSERVGRMRTWLWEFMAWVGKEWGIVQDAWWWNPSMLPNGGACNAGLMRASIKACIWVGAAECWRLQDAVLWEPNWDQIAEHSQKRIVGRHKLPSGNSVNYQRVVETVKRRSGTTPFNLLPFVNGNSTLSAGAEGHGAGTPLALARWWARYICPPRGTILDPFSGTGTMGLGALSEGRDFIGIERDEGYHIIAQKRIAEAEGPLFATPVAPAPEPQREPTLFAALAEEVIAL